jgi:hypothetical protein
MMRVLGRSLAGNVVSIGKGASFFLYSVRCFFTIKDKIMKARLLKKLLNNTGYAVSNNDEYIAVGSPMCHNLISVDKKTLKVKYALDTFNEGRKAIKTPELEFIWDKLHELIETGEIQEVINGKDEIGNPLPVFTVTDGVLVESVTDEYGWPNTDDNGITMYENTHFPTKKQAIEYGIEEYRAAEEWSGKRVKAVEEDLLKAKARHKEYQTYIANLEGILSSI